MSLDLKHTEASFSPNSTDSRCLQVAQVPRSQDMAIFGACGLRTLNWHCMMTWVVTPRNFIPANILHCTLL